MFLFFLVLFKVVSPTVIIKSCLSIVSIACSVHCS